ncbi:Zinc finger CCCH domain-containing protein 7B [Saguinus oedipus]|uniref:Zinc finger CCCH domain-containing protein 7B n=1 Tax=Saguinus oedipus TaxID=9490 RepID=A0ABQ9WHH6_SAGOE|nr:Zinc finger CCCH domain-containing protein 7B [Saguinus oedipus]
MKLGPPVSPRRRAFLLKLVQNLFAEGNDLFREKDYKQALVQYMEGLNVADYAASDQVALPRELLCKLHVNRAACYFIMVSLAPSFLSSSTALITTSPDAQLSQAPTPASP